MPNPFDLGNADVFLASYLTQERRKGFLEELKNFPDCKPIYARVDDPEPLQGDGWAGVTVLRFDDGSRDRIKAVLLTNSCDVSQGGATHLPQGLNFAPIVELAKYEALVARELGQERANHHVTDVKQQKVSSIFYLPDAPGLGGDSIVLLDSIHTVPLEHFREDQAATRLFTLSDVGFWLFLFKLSFHFCRFHESVDRTPTKPVH